MRGCDSAVSGPVPRARFVPRCDPLLLALPSLEYQFNANKNHDRNRNQADHKGEFPATQRRKHRSKLSENKQNFLHLAGR